MIEASPATGEQFCAALGLPFGPRVTIRPVARGAMGQVWCLDLGTVRYAVKELFWQADEAAIRREAACAERMAAAGIRLPRSLPGPAGRLLVRLPACAGGRWLRYYQWVDGSPVDLADPSVAGLAGDLLGRLHAKAPPPGTPDDQPGDEPGGPDDQSWYETVPDLASWDRLTEAGLAAAAAWAPDLARSGGLLRELTGLVVPADRAGLVTCHRDMHPENVLVSPGPELILLDWDDVGPASPDRELARMLADWFGCDGPVDAAAVRRAMAAYRAAGGPGRLTDERSFGMMVACRLNFLHRQLTSDLDPAAGAGHRAFAATEIAFGLANLPTPALMAELIALAAG